MATMSIHSRAIHSSISESERIRVAGMLLVLAATFCLALLRRLLATESSEAMLLERTMWLRFFGCIRKWATVSRAPCALRRKRLTGNSLAHEYVC